MTMVTGPPATGPVTTSSSTSVPFSVENGSAGSSRTWAATAHVVVVVARVTERIESPGGRGSVASVVIRPPTSVRRTVNAPISLAPTRLLPATRTMSSRTGITVVAAAAADPLTPNADKTMVKTAYPLGIRPPPTAVEGSSQSGGDPDFVCARLSVVGATEIDATTAARHNRDVVTRFLADAQERAALLPGNAGAATVVRDVEFARPGDHALLLDLYLPAQPATGLVPVIVWLFGGGWQFGDRTHTPPLVEQIAGRGLAIASIDYRLSSTALFPAQLDDVRAAVRWLRDHASEHGLDDERVGLWGGSAGGFLAALAATTSTDDADRVQAVVDCYGPASLATMDSQRGPDDLIHDSPDSSEALLLGVTLADAPAELTRAVDTVAHVTAGAPPFLLLHGTEDRLVPPAQNLALHEALVAAGVDSTLCLVEGGRHDLFNDLLRRPAPQAEIRTAGGVSRGPVGFDAIERFFDRHLRRDPWTSA